ncbi:restriction endonuclease subunit S [Marinospirillum minutulum]|uniref:restriction endonuclease subunit S n=1 Tax=Marinospirillum minutulum TaxID=64974 RepID=UPI00048094AD|nr:restriction endonuclease subunit S [Marinospirillum minutulum]
MSAEWPVVLIDNIKSGIKGAIAIGPFGSRMKSDCYVDKGVPVIRGTNITGGPKFEGNFVYISEEKAQTLGSSNVFKNDLVFPHRGSIGEVGIIQDNEQYVISSSLMKLTCDTKIANPKFIYYFFKSYLGRHQLLKNASQVGTPGIGQPLTSLKSIEIKLPPIEVQDRIDCVLSSIDEKIELNRQTNQTLVQIAQAIFKSWFVDFEPTRAKIIAKEQGANSATQELAAQAIICGAITLEQLAEVEQNLETTLQQAIDEKLNQHKQTNPTALNAQQLKTTAALFPNELVESELGDVPKGWEVKALDEIAHYQNGLALQKFRPEGDEESLPVLKIAQLRKGFADGEERASANIKPECIVDNGDVVFSWSGSLIVDIWCGGKVALNQHLFKVTSQNYPKWFYYYWTKRHLEVFQQIAADKAVTMGHIKREHLSQAKCLVPADNLLELGVISNLLKKQVLLNLENFSLENIRDALLPKLLSGELRVNSGSHIT